MPAENDLYRKCIEELKSWSSTASRGVMVVRGARQVGKTTLIRLLAKELGLTLIEVNLEDLPSFAGMLAKRSNAMFCFSSMRFKNFLGSIIIFATLKSWRTNTR
jgi:AAA+ ATPase superfamily predicted ATPase